MLYFCESTFDAIRNETRLLLHGHHWHAIPKDDLKSHSIIFLIVQIFVFSAKGTISKAANKMFAKDNQFFVFFIKSWNF